jgi:hypothetical protein
MSSVVSSVKDVVVPMPNLLFKYTGDGSVLTGKSVNVRGAAGIESFLRGPKARGPAKYSTLTLVMDKIFIHHDVKAYEKDDSVYVSFTDDGNTYHAIYDGVEILWINDDPQKQYLNLIPLLCYALSDIYEKNESSIELRSNFVNIKNDINVSDSALLLCDAFYYGFVLKDNHDNINIRVQSMDVGKIENAVKKRIYKPIEIFEGLCDINTTDASAGAAFIPVKEEKKPSYEVTYNYWSEEAKSKIPSLNTLKTYVPTKKMESIVRKVKYHLDKVIERLDNGIEGVEAIGNDYINILLVGRPAAGKTALTNAVAAMTHLPIYPIPFSKNTEEDTMEGKNKVKEGKIDFVETEFLKAFEHGGIIVCEEINLADPGVVMGAMGQAIEFPFILMKDGYIPIKRHPLCVIIGTMNTGTVGSKKLNQALSSRFKSTYTIDDPDEKTFIKILQSKGYEQGKCKYVYDAYKAIHKYLQDPQQNQLELCENITLRGCIGALECWEEGDEPKEAIVNSLVGKIAEVNLQAANDVETQVIDSLRDYSGSGRRSRR